jgi:uncharacterized protein YbaR (Trm112 family)
VKRSLLDILACPMDRHHPLTLVEFASEGDKVVDGLMVCGECGRYYPISGEIANMLPDGLRSRKEDLEFLRRWREKVPPEVARKGKPWNLEEP